MNYQESFLNYLKYERRYSPHTLVAYKKDLSQLVQYCIETGGGFDIKEVTPKLLRDWVVFLMESGLEPRSVNRKVSTVKSFFKYLMKEEAVGDNPVFHIPLPKVRKKLPFFVDEESLNHLLDDGLFDPGFEGVRDKLIVAMLYGTGIRLSELISLKDSDINRVEFLIKVLGKRNKERIIPYPRSLNSVLDGYVALRNERFEARPEFLLVTDKGEKVYAKLIYRVVKNNLDKVTTLEKKSPHILRHTYATHLLNRGADLNAVKELLGHANLAATQIYTHTSFEKLQNVYKQTHPRG